jgi:hypothetical protein
MIPETTDYKKTLANLYNPPKQKFVFVDIPVMPFLMIDGIGDPDKLGYQEAVSALYSLAYALKFAIKKQGIMDFKVMPLEGLWWHPKVAEISLEALLAVRDEWQWTMMIMQPDIVTPELFDEVRNAVQTKKKQPTLASVRLESYDEGRVVQTMYLGPYKDEAPTITKLHDFIHAEGYQERGKHHEIYLGDPTKSAPEKLRTILRQPISRS